MVSEEACNKLKIQRERNRIRTANYRKKNKENPKDGYKWCEPCSKLILIQDFSEGKKSCKKHLGPVSDAEKKRMKDNYVNKLKDQRKEIRIACPPEGKVASESVVSITTTPKPRRKKTKKDIVPSKRNLGVNTLSPRITRNTTANKKREEK